MNQMESYVSHNSNAPSMLMYSHDGFGLGHLKRNFTIAKKFVQEVPGSQALLIMGHALVPFHPIPQGIDFVKLPGIVKTNHEAWQPRSLSMEPEALKNFRASLILNVAEHFQPDIFIVDYVPKGVWGELLPTLEFLRERSQKTKIILGLRDIIDDPKLTCSRWEKGHIYKIIRDYYDQIFIYGASEIFDTAHHYALADKFPEKIHYCGYLFTEDLPKLRERTRRGLHLEKDKLIVITAGGGADAYPMMKMCLDALELLLKEVSAEALFITGPLMDPTLRKKLEEASETLPAKILTLSDGILNYMNAADLLVTMGSYNTLMEAMRLERPTLVIPREGPSAEQRMRARLFSERGYLNAILQPSQITSEILAKRMVASLENVPCSFPFKKNGLQNVLSHLIEEKPVKEEEKPLVEAITA